MSGADSKFILQCIADSKEKSLEEIEYEALSSAIEALEKQMPTYATKIQGNYYCRPCIMPLDKERFKYCPSCGREIIYPNEEENENASKSME